MDSKNTHLLELLEKAAAEMISYGNQSTISYFDTCDDVGFFIQEIISKARNGEVQEISKLWYIFAPTGVWDDSHGSQEIANEIFEIINKHYQPETDTGI